jgi:hypothetical protein
MKQESKWRRKCLPFMTVKCWSWCQYLFWKYACLEIVWKENNDIQFLENTAYQMRKMNGCLAY